jgi:tetratricopeptide (TPR) repeat protein
MPSHIFVRLGLWDEAVRANMASTSSARCYAENAGIDGHWDEELHGLDYLVYAYLQQGENGPAREQYDYLQTIRSVSPVNFKGAYAFAAIPSRWVLENKLWTDASRLELHPKDFPWSKFPWQESIVHFTRLLGFAHTGKTDSARMELTTLEKLHDILMSQKDQYKADQVMVQIEAGKAWISYKEGDHRDAIRMMSLAADREERMEKHPVTPGPVIPARELLGDLLLAMQRPDEALAAYEADLKDQPNRFNGVYGVAATCEMINDRKKAREYYQQLISLANNSASERSELKKARAFVQNN